jgi:hypothetical protein
MIHLLRWQAISLSVLGALAIGAGCGSENNDAAKGDGGLSSSGGSSGLLGDGGNVFGDGGYLPGDGSPGSCVPLVLADGTIPQCADCMDNDGDGKVDWQDPECAGPLDNDERTFGTGIAGDNMDACKQDCFFDGNSGAGDDRCEWNLKCDPANTAGQCAYDPNFRNCPGTQRAECINFCAKLTPNGCDCFGCCAVPQADGGVVNVTLSSTCSLADIGDPTKCPRCTPNPNCNNPCDRCELCLGKTTLPADCAQPDGGGSGQTCSSGEVCNETTACPAGKYCVTGCCVPVLR